MHQKHFFVDPEYKSDISLVRRWVAIVLAASVVGDAVAVAMLLWWQP